MFKSIISSQGFSNFMLNYGDVIVHNLKWIIPTFAVTGLGIYAVNTYADHDAMEHGYERTTKAGPFETSVKRLPPN